MTVRAGSVFATAAIAAAVVTAAGGAALAADPPLATEGAEDVAAIPKGGGGSRCLFCHARPDFAEKARSDGTKGLFVDATEFSYSVHGKRNCWECHADADVLPHRKDLDRVQCRRCHYVGNTVGAPQSRRYKQYQESVHGRLAATGDTRAPLCQDCHGTHAVRPSDDPTSKVHRRSIPEDCGRCHAAPRKAYDDGIHGVEHAKGNPDAPVCTDCHSEHEIRRHDDPGSRVFVTHVPEACGRCHEDQQVMNRYGIDAKQVATYKSSFHGVALKFGMLRVANCQSCHDHHAVLPDEDPRSPVNVTNLAATCGKPGCHPGASENFARGRIHISAHEESAGKVYWVALAFKWLTISVIAGLVLHIGADLARRGIERRRRGKGSGHGHRDGGEGVAAALGTRVQRLDLFVRIQHGSMAISVILLILTGVPVKFHETAWAVSVMSVVGGLEVTGFVHRVAATILMAVAAAHLIYITATLHGRFNFREMLPGPGDLRDAIHNIGYFLGARKERPAFPRFSYLEKFDYWAVYWGVVVMAGGGLVLWFETRAMSFMPKEWVDISKEMHSDEAMLATLAIVIWHMFNAHFNPDKFPMNKVFWHGWTDVGELLHEHPKELVAMLRKGEVRRALVEEVARTDARARAVLDEAFPPADPGAPTPMAPEGED